MATSVQSFETNHEDVIHDAQLDYYGKRLATCSSDRTIKIFDVTNDQRKQIGEIKGHEGPVWQVSWAHPQFGSILASCSYDHKVLIWREQSPANWVKITEYKHNSSVNSIAWAPHELGLILASASSDSSIMIVSYNEQKNSWDTKVIQSAHQIGCNSICWAPSASSGSLLTTTSNEKSTTLVRKLLSGGGDNTAKIWSFDGENWSKETELRNHSDWVRDVAWAPNVGLPYDMIATASQDQSVWIYTCEQSGTWTAVKQLKFNSVVWRVSWNLTGSILAVTTADGKVSLYKEGLDNNEWTQLAELNGQQ